MSKDYKQVLLNALPPSDGVVWNTVPGSNMDNFLSWWAEELNHIDEQLDNLILEANPLTMSQMMMVRYAEVGLPNICRGEPATIEEHRAEILAKWRGTGGQSIGYYQDVLNTYGFTTATITEYSPFQAGRSTAGAQIGDAFNFCWQVTYQPISQDYFHVDANVADDLLDTIQTGGIPCILNEIKPAHTTIIFTPLP